MHYTLSDLGIEIKNSCVFFFSGLDNKILHRIKRTKKASMVFRNALLFTFSDTKDEKLFFKHGRYVCSLERDGRWLFVM